MFVPAAVSFASRHVRTRPANPTVAAAAAKALHRSGGHQAAAAGDEPRRVSAERLRTSPQMPKAARN